MNAPADWDNESYCCVEHCHQPATHRKIEGMIGDLPLYEMVCCTHAEVPTAIDWRESPRTIKRINDRFKHG